MLPPLGIGWWFGDQIENQGRSLLVRAVMAILCVASPASGASVPNWGPVKRLSPSPGIDAFVGSIAINDRGDAVVAARIERRIVAPVSPLRVP